jgi:hypothetical protein
MQRILQAGDIEYHEPWGDKDVGNIDEGMTEK